MNSLKTTLTAAIPDLNTLTENPEPLPECMFYRWTAGAKACGGSGTKTVRRPASAARARCRHRSGAAPAHAALPMLR
jgi:hypothetical protein